jgi:hypothetical protein
MTAIKHDYNRKEVFVSPFGVIAIAQEPIVIQLVDEKTR